MTIEGNSYINLLINLRDVAEEAKICIKGAEEIKSFDIPEFRQAAEACSASNRDVVIKKISAMVSKWQYLVVYEAALRTNLPQIGSKFLEIWQNKLEKKINSQLPIESNSLQRIGFLSFFESNKKNTSQEIIEEKLNKIFSKIQWPFFKSDKPEESIQKGLKHLLAKELIFRKFHAGEVLEIPPPHITSRLGNQTPTKHEAFLINNYSHLVKKIFFSDPSMIVNGDIELYLNRFREAEYLNLSNCIRLTPSCLDSGHSKIQKIVLTGTCIKKEDISSKNFPNVKGNIQQENVLNILLFKSINWYQMRPTEEAWKNLKEKIQLADKILLTPEDLRHLFQFFKQDPTREGIQAILFLKYHFEKVEPENTTFGRTTLLTTIEFNRKLTETLLDLLKQTTIHDWKLESNGHFILDVIFKIWLEKTKYTKECVLMINEVFLDILTLTTICLEGDSSRMNERTSRKIRFRPNENDFSRARALNRKLRLYSWKHYGEITTILEKNIKFIEQKIFYMKSSRVEPDEVRLIEFFYEIFVEASYHIDDPELGPFQNLIYPHPVVSRTQPSNNDSMVLFNTFLNAVSSEPFPPGPYFHLSMDQKIACAFVLNIPNSNQREAFLLKILQNLNQYKPTNYYYSLSKLLFGRFEESDIPPHDHASLIKERLLNYKGVFKEPISFELKEKFLDNLINEKLGEISEALVDGLFHLCKQEITEKWKKKIIEGLGKISGIIGFDPILHYAYRNEIADTPLKNYARGKLKELNIF